MAGWGRARSRRGKSAARSSGSRMLLVASGVLRRLEQIAALQYSALSKLTRSGTRGCAASRASDNDAEVGCASGVLYNS